MVKHDFAEHLCGQNVRPVDDDGEDADNNDDMLQLFLV